MAKRKKISSALVVFLILDALVLGAVGSYYLAQRSFTKKMAQIEAQKPENLVKEATAKVLPADGYTTQLKWGDIVKKLVEAGAIDPVKYREIYNSKTNGAEQLTLLEGESDQAISIDENNAYFLVNTLWALGLTQKSIVLDEGPMTKNTANYASTGGWILGKKTAMELYSSQELIPLNEEQQDLVQKIAGNVYRPCCGNSVAFPDCNHGMAALGYIELAVAAGLSEEQIYQDLLAFNSYWFPDTYVEMAVYFQQQEGLSWDKVDAKTALSYDYSSAAGAQKIKQAVQSIPGLKSQGGSCGA
ncbi:hypothetical protein A3I57_00925 [Candidatus Beckwithbacteria bacterium RIFCSPLOWO2_02_FULL_47_23]|uniref:Uncharacterized protein n=2 Tax=Candidatus Beckwithiibacteriota TaxID=1752726 RepID=A0A1F5DUS2_9BACT|nr:MAG: hypothetical protein A3E73_02925 [Candidatus Beckwithbacteria bacterium RIFCSPHIGHO2_12_FULL_47_17]OGD58883.1 MAG: hypothetical protein A3I57_00925 [Candidatus Beckwithbacteria bacterium RIFCSPLOWO2_02_FULL_47_23]